MESIEENIERVQTARRRFTRLVDAAGLPEPDEVHYFEEEDELEFHWHEQKLVVVVDLEGRSVEPEPD
jgi:hypothetical protein